MSLTKPLNSKANMKQYSNADLPINPKQPAMARYAAESTLNQTVINLPFQVDTVNAADSFMLSVDGKVLTPGALNDYQFTAIDSFGFSSTVTLTFPIAAGLNIQGIKLGLKKETEFAQDARFTALYESQDQGFQGFVRTADIMVATNSVGTPGTGQFYSTIVNRASIPDLRIDLKARMGIDRMMFKSIQQIQGEFGPNGEMVSGVSNDPLGLVRVVGETDFNANSAGQYIRVGVNNSLNTGYIEITFYGTGLNLLIFQPGASHTAVYSVDGGSESANFVTTVSTAVQSGRNYSANVVNPVVNNLAQGVHTIRIRNTGAASLHLHGIEILNQASTLYVQPGASYLAGKKISTLAQAALVYNSGFETGTLGTRGGRVVVYQKADGTIAKAVQPVDAAALTFTATNHQNEEIARVHNWREFSAGRSDDYGSVTTSGTVRAFTLDDGTTTLQSTNAVTDVNIGEALSVTAGTTNYSMLTFVGTGLDVELISSVAGFARSMSFSIDGGASIGTVSYPSAQQRIVVKIASGLPYGTHTVKFSNASASLNAPGITKFIVYQPKKPTVPAGAVELADYNVMANFAANATQASEAIASGVLRKAAARELAFAGTYTDGLTVNTGTTGAVAGYRVLGATAGNTVRYTFFGTGFDLRLSTPVAVNTFTIAIDGTNPTAAGATATGFYGQWTSFVAATGVATSNGSGQFATGLWVSGLALGMHTLVITQNGTASYGVESLDVITPIHSPKNDLYYEIQNTLLVGSCGISDNRKISPIEDASLQPKASAQAIGISSGPTNSSTAYVPVPDMSVTVKTSGGSLDIAAMMAFTNAVNTSLAIYVDGVLAPGGELTVGGSGSSVSMNLIATVPVSIGYHKVDLYWKTSSGTVTASTTLRTLKVKEN